MHCSLVEMMTFMALVIHTIMYKNVMETEISIKSVISSNFI